MTKEDLIKFNEWLGDNHTSFKIPDMIIQDYTGYIPRPVGSTVWKATMQLRWIESTKANDPRLGVRFSNDIGWGWTDNIVLQQKWISDHGDEKWEDVELCKHT